jgi:hypothetical protein
LSEIHIVPSTLYHAMTSATESSAIAPAAFVVESIASPDAIPVDNNAAAPLEQASEQASNALDQSVASTETTSESKQPEEPQAAPNEPALVDANEPALVVANAAEPADANEKALDHVDAKLIATEKADLVAASNEPAPADSKDPAPVDSKDPAPADSKDPAPVGPKDSAPADSKDLAPSDSKDPVSSDSKDPEPAADSKDPAPAADAKDDKMDETAASNLIETEKALDLSVASVDDSMAVDQVPSPTSSVAPAAISKAGTPDKSQIEEEAAPTKGGKRAGKKATAEPAAKKAKA